MKTEFTALSTRKMCILDGVSPTTCKPSFNFRCTMLCQTKFKTVLHTADMMMPADVNRTNTKIHECISNSAMFISEFVCLVKWLLRADTWIQQAWTGLTQLTSRNVWDRSNKNDWSSPLPRDAKWRSRSQAAQHRIWQHYKHTHTRDVTLQSTHHSES